MTSDTQLREAALHLMHSFGRNDVARDAGRSDQRHRQYSDMACCTQPLHELTRSGALRMTSDFKQLRELREAAKKATPGPWCVNGKYSVKSREVGHLAVATADPCRLRDANAAFIALANPTRVLSLLDRLEALEEILRAVSDSRVEWKARALSAEAQLAEALAALEPFARLSAAVEARGARDGLGGLEAEKQIHRLTSDDFRRAASLLTRLGKGEEK